MVRLCSCPASRQRWRAAPKTRRRRPQGLAMKLIRRQLLASGRGRCRAAGRLAYCARRNVSVAPGAARRPFRSRRSKRHHCPCAGTVALGAVRPTLRDREPARCGNQVGTEAVVNATPDGYTVLIVSSPHAINATLYEKLHFNFMRDIAPVAGILRAPNVMVVAPASGQDRFPIISLCQSQSGQAQFRVFGHRGVQPYVRGVVQDHDRDRDGARSLPQFRAGAD